MRGSGMILSEKTLRQCQCLPQHINKEINYEIQKYTRRRYGICFSSSGSRMQQVISRITRPARTRLRQYRRTCSYACAPKHWPQTVLVSAVSALPVE